jgi:hypothetical protein
VRKRQLWAFQSEKESAFEKTDLTGKFLLENIFAIAKARSRKGKTNASPLSTAFDLTPPSI